MSIAADRIQDHFQNLSDPRRQKVLYPLINIVTIALCAVISGADDFASIAEFGRTKRKWLEQFLDLRAGIPSHDRFNAILRAIKPAEFEQCLLSFVTALHPISGGQLVAIDGKTLRRSFDKASGKTAIHMISAWATANQISLGQVVTDAKRIHSLRGMEHGGVQRHLPNISAVIERALELHEHDLPQSERKNSRPQLNLLGQFLSTALGSICRKASVAASLVGTAQDVRDLIAYRLGLGGFDEGELPALATGWRAEVVGQVIDHLLAGDVSIRIADPLADEPLAFEKVEK